MALHEVDAMTDMRIVVEEGLVVAAAMMIPTDLAMMIANAAITDDVMTMALVGSTDMLPAAAMIAIVAAEETTIVVAGAVVTTILETADDMDMEMRQHENLANHTAVAIKNTALKTDTLVGKHLQLTRAGSDLRATSGDWLWLERGSSLHFAFT